MTHLVTNMVTKISKKHTTMSSISVFTHQSKIDKNGNLKVFLRIAHNGNRFMVATGLSTPGEINGTMFPKSDKNRSAKKKRLDELMAAAEKVLLENADLSARQIKPLVVETLKPTQKAKENLLTDYIERYASTKTGRTVDLYKQTAKRVGEFDPDSSIESVDVTWLRSFERRCASTMKINTISIHMRNIRTVFNWVISEGKTNNYPFARYKIKQEATAKRSLTVKELRILRDYPCAPYQRIYRDVFMLMFYLIGINAKDLLNLTHKNVVNGRIEYTRAKTRKLYSIKIEPEAQEIIKRYKGTKHLISPLDKCGNELNWLHRMNDALKDIGKTCKPGCKKEGNSLFPNLSSYWSRHTWGTLAAELDTPIDVIAHALGHNIPELNVTSIYIRFNEKKVDEANRNVIDFVNSK